jgi:hypothetical protein
LKPPKRAVVEDLFDEPGIGKREAGIEAKQ